MPTRITRLTFSAASDPAVEEVLDPQDRLRTLRALDRLAQGPSTQPGVAEARTRRTALVMELIWKTGVWVEPGDALAEEDFDAIERALTVLAAADRPARHHRARPARNASSSSAGSGCANRYPCAWRQESVRSTSICSSVSTPSATASTPRL